MVENVVGDFLILFCQVESYQAVFISTTLEDPTRTIFPFRKESEVIKIFKESGI